MTPNIDKFVSQVSDRLKANGGKIPAPLYFEIGKLCGMTCKQVVEAKKEHFPTNVRGARKAVANKTAAVKPKFKKKPAADRAKASKVIAGIKMTKAQLKGADESTGIVENNENSFVWIASPEEIASTEELHTTDY